MRLIGHQDEIKIFRQSFSSGIKSHGCLFVGERGIGKGTLARECAAWLINGMRDEGLEEVLLSMENRINTAYMEIGADDGIICINTIRNIQNFVMQSTETTRVVVIDGAEKMNDNASAALLKTLEEPSTKVVFLITVNDIANIDNAIKSRCIRINIGSLTIEESLKILVSLGMPESEINKIMMITAVPMHVYRLYNLGILEKYISFLSLLTGKNDVVISEDYTVKDIVIIMLAIMHRILRVHSGNYEVLCDNEDRLVSDIINCIGIEGIYTKMEYMLKIYKNATLLHLDNRQAIVSILHSMSIN